MKRIDNIDRNGHKICLMEPKKFEQVIDEQSNIKVEYDEEDLNLNTAIDFILFCLTKEDTYIASKLYEWGCTQDFIGDELGSQTYSSKHFARTMKSLDKKKQEILKMAQDYSRVQNKMSDIKNRFLEKYSGVGEGDI